MSDPTRLMSRAPRTPSWIQWTPAGRVIVFALSATSIGCLLSEFHGLTSMRAFAICVLVPATVLLAFLAALDRAVGDRRLWRAVVVGTIAGLVAAIAYDVFRLPFVFSKGLGIDRVVPALRLFKVFPRFGAMLLGEPIEQPEFSLAAHLLGWGYHFSNGATFGIMYVAMIGEASRRSWGWAVVFATGLELGMLVNPYARVFAIHVTAPFVAVTLTAHVLFGVALGLWARWHERRWALDAVTA